MSGTNLPALPASGSTSWYTHYAAMDAALRTAVQPLDPERPIPQTQQAGPAYTLVLADLGTLVEVTSATAASITVPTNAVVAAPIGTRIKVRQYGAGQVTIAPAAGVTIDSRGALLKTAGQFAEVLLTKRAVDEWVLTGDRA